MKLARIVLGSALLPACVTLLGCSSTPEGDDTPGKGGAATAGRPAVNAGGGNAGYGNAGNAPSSGGYGNAPSGTAGYSAGGYGNAPSGTAGYSAGGFGNAPGGAGAGAGGRTGGFAGAGGRPGGAAGATGASGAAGAPPTGSVDCSSTPAALTGGTVHTSKNDSKQLSNKLWWTIWSNGPTAGSITTYDSVPAFSASWNDSSDFLARLGAQWDNTKTYDQLGTVTAELDYTKSGTGGGYSYIGIYGWSSDSPCVEWYIVDDSFNNMPVNPGNTKNNGTVTIDGGDYILYSRPTMGTGGSKCKGNLSSWDQYYSVRKTKRDCGQISISEHFKAWAAHSMPLGKMDQAQVLVEVGGGQGKVDFTTASVTVTPP